MRGIVLSTVVAAGLSAAAYALGDENFDHAHPGGVPAEEVVVPGADGQNIDELAEQYAQALERVQTATAPTPAVTPLAQSLADQVSQLPWTVFDSSLDADGDGLSGADEARFGTRAGQADTDGDGYVDGLEMVRGYNPLAPSPGDKIDFSQSAPEEAPPAAELRLMDVRIEQQGGQSVLVVTGLGPPNAVLTLFVYSMTPRVVVVRADDSGRWRVVLDDTLPEGSHVAYVALTDAAGKVQQASTPLTFERTAVGIVHDGAAVSPAPSNAPLPDAAPRAWRRWALSAVAVLAVGAVIGAWLLLRRRSAALAQPSDAVASGGGVDKLGMG